jgi:hypothetical protein
VETAIDTRSTMTIETIGFWLRNPASARAWATKNELNVPAMNTSPWAKLIMNRMPYTRV